MTKNYIGIRERKRRQYEAKMVFKQVVRFAEKNIIKGGNLEFSNNENVVPLSAQMLQ